MRNIVFTVDFNRGIFLNTSGIVEFVAGDANSTTLVFDIADMVTGTVRLNMRNSNIDGTVTSSLSVSGGSASYVVGSGILAEAGQIVMSLTCFDTAYRLTDIEYQGLIRVREALPVTEMPEENTEWKDSIEEQLSALNTSVAGKVDKVNGKGLSSNDYTDEDKLAVSNLTQEINSAVSTHNSSSSAHSDIRGAIPTKVSDLTNDSGYLTNKGVVAIGNGLISSHNSSSSAHSDIRAAIPTKTGDLTNDAGFITRSVSDLSNYTDNTSLTGLLDGKVDKVTGKVLSSNDYTDEDKATVGAMDDAIADAAAAVTTANAANDTAAAAAATAISAYDTAVSVVTRANNGEFNGKDGEKGDKGDPGIQGEKGDKGDPGLPGAPGADGADGAPGADGKDGKDGKDGVDGEVTNAALAVALYAKADVITDTITGTTGSTTYASDMPLKGLSVYGQSSQNGTPTPTSSVAIVSATPTVTITNGTDTQTVTLPVLRGLFAAYANYTTYMDGNSQRWYADTLDLEAGTITRRIGAKLYAGAEDESWLYNSTNGVFLNSTGTSATGVANVYALCNSFVNAGTNSASGVTDGTFTVQTNGNLIVKHLAITQTAEAWKAWLANNNLVVLYGLANPTTEELTSEQIAALQALHTYKPNTTISVDTWLNAEYRCDTKLYIDSKITQAVLALT